MLATAYHETARTMQAIAEYGKGSGKPYGKVDAKTGKAYYGRGLVQLTWAENYKKMGKLLKLPLYLNPDLALQLPIAVQIMFEGMLRAESFRGDFTGKSLEDYFTSSKTDWINARRIVNGLDKANMIASYARKFHEALVAADEPFKSPQALKRSRTVAAGTGTATVGAAQVGQSGHDLYEAATQAEGHISAGTWFGIGIGVVLIGFGLYAVYSRWDDAGRPSLRAIFRGADA